MTFMATTKNSSNALGQSLLQRTRIEEEGRQRAKNEYGRTPHKANTGHRFRRYSEGSIKWLEYYRNGLADSVPRNERQRGYNYGCHSSWKNGYRRRRHSEGSINRSLFARNALSSPGMKDKKQQFRENAQEWRSVDRPKDGEEEGDEHVEKNVETVSSPKTLLVEWLDHTVSSDDEASGGDCKTLAGSPFQQDDFPSLSTALAVAPPTRRSRRGGHAATKSALPVVPEPLKVLAPKAFSSAWDLLMRTPTNAMRDSPLSSAARMMPEAQESSTSSAMSAGTLPNTGRDSPVDTATSMMPDAQKSDPVDAMLARTPTESSCHSTLDTATSTMPEAQKSGPANAMLARTPTPRSRDSSLETIRSTMQETQKCGPADAMPIAQTSGLADVMPIAQKSEPADAISVAQKSDPDDAMQVAQASGFADVMPIAQKSDSADAMSVAQENDPLNAIPIAQKSSPADAMPIAQISDRADAMPIAQNSGHANAVSVALGEIPERAMSMAPEKDGEEDIDFRASARKKTAKACKHRKEEKKREEAKEENDNEEEKIEEKTDEEKNKKEKNSYTDIDQKAKQDGPRALTSEKNEGDNASRPRTNEEYEKDDVSGAPTNREYEEHEERPKTKKAVSLVHALHRREISLLSALGDESVCASACNVGPKEPPTPVSVGSDTLGSVGYDARVYARSPGGALNWPSPWGKAKEVCGTSITTSTDVESETSSSLHSSSNMLKRDFLRANPKMTPAQKYKNKFIARRLKAKLAKDEESSNTASSSGASKHDRPQRRVSLEKSLPCSTLKKQAFPLMAPPPCVVYSMQYVAMTPTALIASHPLLSYPIAPPSAAPMPVPPVVQGVLVSDNTQSPSYPGRRNGLNPYVPRNMLPTVTEHELRAAAPEYYED